jgi:hypothetical protein
MSGERPADLVPTRMEVSRDQLEKVIHRAAELQFGRGDEEHDSLEAAEVLRIAEEVGLEGRFVRQALAEMRADALLPARPEDRSTATRLWGPAVLVAARVVPGEPQQIQDRLARYLEERQSMRRVRDRPGQQVYEPASDLWSQLQRGLDVGGRGYELAKARSVSVMVQPLEEGRSLVSITADIANQRTGHAAAWYGSLGSLGLGAALGAMLGAGAPELIVIPAAAGGIGIAGTLGTSWTLGRRRSRMELAVQGLLDRLEKGERLTPERPSLRERITEFLDER